MAIDFGTKRIGIAISDEMRMLASPRGTIPGGASAIPEILALAKKENVRRVVMGLPTNLSGGDTDMTRQVRSFGEKLARKLAEVDIVMEFRDERLTSVMANAHIAERGLRKSKREEKGLRDEEAARIVLQEYIDKLRRNSLS